MKKPIKKNLTDLDMLAGYVEKKTFETDLSESEKPVTKPKPVLKKNAAADFTDAFFSQELREDVCKALLELKVKLYKEGIVDYKLKVSQEGRQVILTALPITPSNPADRKEKKS